MLPSLVLGERSRYTTQRSIDVSFGVTLAEPVEDEHASVWIVRLRIVVCVV